MNIVQPLRQDEALGFPLARRIEETEMDALAMARHDRHIDAAVAQGDAGWAGDAAAGRKPRVQVITEGAARPVRASMPVSVRDN